MKLNISKCSWSAKAAIIGLGGFALGATGGAIMFGSFGVFAGLGLLKVPVGLALGYLGSGIIMKPFNLKNKIQYFIEKALSEALETNQRHNLKISDDLQTIDQKVFIEALQKAREAIVEEYNLNPEDANWSKLSGNQYNKTVLQPLFKNHVSIKDGVEQITGDLLRVVIDQSFDKMDEQLDTISKCGRRAHND